MKRTVMILAGILMIGLLCSNALISKEIDNELTVKGMYFYLNDGKIPLWGVRVASASQSEENTRQLIAALDDYKRHGVNAISVYLQGSSGGFSDPFSRDGKQIDPDHLDRLTRIIRECQTRDMVVIVGIFYQRTMAGSGDVRNLSGSEAVFRAVETVVRELKPYRNLIINIANEQNSGRYRAFKHFDFNDPENMVSLCREVKELDPDRIVGAGGYHDSSNVVIGRSEWVDVLLFDTYSSDVLEGHHSGWHCDYFRENGVLDKPMLNVEIFGGWTLQFMPPGVYTEEGKALHLREIDEAVARPGLQVHFHSNPWIQGPRDGLPARYDLGGNGTADDPGISWWFEHLASRTKGK